MYFFIKWEFNILSGILTLYDGDMKIYCIIGVTLIRVDIKPLSPFLSHLKDFFHCVSQKRIQKSDSESRVMHCSRVHFFTVSVYV